MARLTAAKSRPSLARVLKSIMDEYPEKRAPMLATLEWALSHPVGSPGEERKKRLAQRQLQRIAGKDVWSKTCQKLRSEQAASVVGKD